MQRIILYLSAYCITLVLGIVGGESAGGIVFASFLICTLVYTFSREGLPDMGIINYPEAFRYRAKRLNIYGYGMLILFICSSILISFNSSWKVINQTLLVLTLWPLMAVGSYILTRLHSSRENIYDLADFISLRMSTELDYAYTKWLIGFSSEDDLPKSYPKNMGYNTKFIRETYRLKEEYEKSESIKLSYKEIQAASTKPK